MGLPWFKVKAAITRHPKVLKLADLLNEPLAGWYFMRLLSWCSDFSPEGVITGGANGLELTCGWRGKPGRLADGMRQVGLIEVSKSRDANGHLHADEASGEVWEVHDWWEEQGAHIEKALKDAERKRQLRERRRAAGLSDRREHENAPGAGRGRVDRDLDLDQKREEEDDRSPAATSSKKKSWQELIFAEMQATRVSKLHARGVEVDVEHVKPALINTVIAKISEHAGDDREAALRAFDAYLDETWPADKQPPYAFQVFASEKVWPKLVAKLDPQFEGEPN